MRIQLPALACLLLLGGCGYTIDKHIQDVTVRTPGAHNAVCYLNAGNIRYKVNPPETINISKSGDDMIVDCLAPGNRRKKVVIEANISGSAPWNVVTGVVPGVTWDYASGALYTYPDLIEVNFENTPTQPMPLPDQNQPDIKQPEEYPLEEFSPSQPRMNYDRYTTQTELRRRQVPGQGGGTYTDSFVPESTGPVQGKGNLGIVTQGASASMDPGAPATPVVINPNAGQDTGIIGAPPAAAASESSGLATESSAPAGEGEGESSGESDGAPIPLFPGE